MENSIAGYNPTRFKDHGEIVENWKSFGLYRIILPWPPSVNRYWRHPAGRHLISLAGRLYRKSVVDTVQSNQQPDGHWSVYRRPIQFEDTVSPVNPMDGRLKVELLAYPPDKRCRDLDNLQKALLDSLTIASVWHDDSQIDILSIYRMNIDPKRLGYVDVRIETIDD